MKLSAFGFQHGRVEDGAGRSLFELAIRPVGFLARLRGLIAHRVLTDTEAWWFTRCAGVHTFGMSFPIDVLHLSQEGRVLRVRAALVPGRIALVLGSAHVIELRAGAAQRLGLHAGMTLRFCQ